MKGESLNDRNIINTGFPDNLNVSKPKNIGSNVLNTPSYCRTSSDSDSELDVVDREPAVAISDIHPLMILNKKIPNHRNTYKITKAQTSLGGMKTDNKLCDKKVKLYLRQNSKRNVNISKTVNVNSE